MKDSPRQQFRWAPHVSGAAGARRKDYEEDGIVEAANEYEAWRLLRESDRPLVVGDLFELESGELRICKYVGFEPARWVLPETRTSFDPLPAPSDSSSGQAPVN